MLYLITCCYVMNVLHSDMFTLALILLTAYTIHSSHVRFCEASVLTLLDERPWEAWVMW